MRIDYRQDHEFYSVVRLSGKMFTIYQDDTGDWGYRAGDFSIQCEARHPSREAALTDLVTYASRLEVRGE